MRSSVSFRCGFHHTAAVEERDTAAVLRRVLDLHCVIVRMPLSWRGRLQGTSDFQRRHTKVGINAKTGTLATARRNLADQSHHLCNAGTPPHFYRDIVVNEAIRTRGGVCADSENPAGTLLIGQAGGRLGFPWAQRFEVALPKVVTIRRRYGFTSAIRLGPWQCAA
jgi:hypothetical protein